MFLLSTASAGASPPVLTAVSAPGLDPDRAWRDRPAWAGVPAAVLRGVGGAEVPSAEVRARWNTSAVYFEFLCRDEAVVSPGQRDGMDHFRLGDVVEIFLGRRGQPAYLEVHATPAGRKTIYAFRAYRRASAPPADAGIRAGAIDGGWRAALAVPWPSGGRPADGAWEFLAGRYDYDEPGGRPDFHARDRSARLELQP